MSRDWDDAMHEDEGMVGDSKERDLLGDYMTHVYGDIVRTLTDVSDNYRRIYRHEKGMHVNAPFYINEMQAIKDAQCEVLQRQLALYGKLKAMADELDETSKGTEEL